jgi:cell division protein ZapA (FtsZ GTPase activity inhibitor)
MDESSNTITVNIYGRSYTIGAKVDRGYIANVAKYLDDKMKEISTNAPVGQSELRTAILAGLFITDELFAKQRENENEQDSIDSRLLALSDLIDETISS